MMRLKICKRITSQFNSLLVTWKRENPSIKTSLFFRLINLLDHKHKLSYPFFLFKCADFFIQKKESKNSFSRYSTIVHKHYY